MFQLLRTLIEAMKRVSQTFRRAWRGVFRPREARRSHSSATSRGYVLIPDDDEPPLGGTRDHDQMQTPEKKPLGSRDHEQTPTPERELLGSRGPHQEPTRVEPLRCFLLDLPTELVLHVGSYLPSLSRLLASHTCLTLYELFGHKGAGGAQLGYKSHIEYLMGVAYDLPTKWVCEECVTLHDFAVLDTPGSTAHCPCPLGWDRQAEGGPHIGSHTYRPHHRHVQIALKHSRLGASSKEHQQHVDSILHPRINYFAVRCSQGGPDSLLSAYLMFPKIMGGRFYVLGIWVYWQRQHAITVDTMGCLHICNHCSWTTSEHHSHGLKVRNELAQTRTRAMMDLTGRALGSCSSCATDFKVSFHSELKAAMVMSWTDLGDERSLTSRARRALVNPDCWQGAPCKVHHRRYGGHRLGEMGDHKPGSIRERFPARVFLQSGRARNVPSGTPEWLLPVP
ncbi:tetrahydroxynaphthalene reductase [Purpureocillium lavendulum]|uniref:Tetrahydroxynaphthalene reductase n=1 Tax=Purpureocillium lavendulum TaxID=1247861 RepID=A0AB34FXC6_9HYPO|nr:tetrahydroxynaphthalene reductase [Purpureocillium lavendulum]